MRQPKCSREPRPLASAELHRARRSRLSASSDQRSAAHSPPVVPQAVSLLQGTADCIEDRTPTAPRREHCCCHCQAAAALSPETEVSSRPRCASRISATRARPQCGGPCPFLVRRPPTRLACLPPPRGPPSSPLPFN